LLIAREGPFTQQGYLVCHEQEPAPTRTHMQKNCSTIYRDIDSFLCYTADKNPSCSMMFGSRSGVTPMFERFCFFDLL